MQESTVTIKGQTTLPKEIRQALGLRAGDRVRYLVLDDGQVRLLRRRPVADLRGCLAEEGRGPVSLQEMDAAIAGGALDRD